MKKNKFLIPLIASGVWPVSPGFSYRIVLVTIIALLAAGDCGWAHAAEGKKSRAEEDVRQRQKTEFMKYYLGDPSKSALPKTAIGVELYNQAAEYYQRHEYALAKQSLTESLVYDSRNPYAHELLGDIENLDQHLEKAKDYYKQAYLLQPTEALKEKIEKLSHEIKIDESFETVTYGRFTIKYQGKSQADEIPRIRKTLKNIYRELSNLYGYALKNQVTVILYEADDFKKITESPVWVAAIYDGKIRLPARLQSFPRQEFQAITAHEMSHAFVAELSKSKAPAWINEGLAEFCAGKIEKRESLVFDAAVRTGTLLPLDQLMIEKKKASENDPLFAKLFYEESYRFVYFLVERYGMFKMKQLLTEFAGGKDSNEALLVALNQSVNQLETEWKHTFAKA